MVFPDYRLRYPTPPNSDVFLDIHPEEWMIWCGGLRQSCPSLLYVATFINFHQFPSIRHLMIVVLEFCCQNALQIGVLASHHAAITRRELEGQVQPCLWSRSLGSFRHLGIIGVVGIGSQAFGPGRLMIYLFFQPAWGWLVSGQMWRCEDDQVVVSSAVENPPLKIRWHVSTWWWVNMKWTKKRETPKSQCLAVNH